MKDYTPGGALAVLADQHTTLRDMIARCEELADALDAGQIEAAQLLREVARIRIAFDAHNQFEEQLLQPVLLDAEWLGAVRVSRMVEDHTEEHRAMKRQLGMTSVPTPTSELRATLADLRAHLVDEEHHFLSRRVLRDDLAH